MKLAQASREKRLRRINVSLIHDNGRSHIALLTHYTLEELNWETVRHPPYSPDLALSDYYLFRASKQHLRDIQFAKVEDLKITVTNFFSAQKLEFWSNGIAALPEHWQQVIDHSGKYIED